MGVGGFFKKLSPWLSAGASFVPGAGPVIAATINKIAGDHGVTLAAPADASMPETMENAVAALTGNAAALAALKKADQDYALQMQAAGFKREIDLETLGNADRDSARKREEDVKDKTPEIGFFLITAGFFGVLLFVILHGVPDNVRDLVNVMIGALGTAWIQSVAYYYGSSRGSDDKTKVLADIAKS